MPLYDWLFASPGREPPWWEPTRAASALANAIASPQASVMVADEEGELVGFCTAYIDLDSVRFGKRCWVEDLAVHPDRRSQGIGAALLESAREWARERDATHFELDTAIARTDAQRFYDSQGGAHKGISYSWEL